MEVQRPQTEADLARVFELRWQVLRAPWGEPRGSERDEVDESRAIADGVEHALIQDATGEPLAVGRLHFNSPDEAQIRYMAVVAAWRRQGLGRRIVEHLEGVARSRGAATVVLNAREEVAGFYRALGYDVVGAGPTLFGSIPHVRMRKQLISQGDC